MALKADRGLRKAKALARKENLALQAFARLEWHVSDAVQAVAAEVFRSCFNRLRAWLPN